MRCCGSMRRSTALRWAERDLVRMRSRSSGEMMVVARIGVGYDAVDVPALSAKNIPLMTAGTANSPSVAEAALFMMMALAKRAAELDEMVKSQSME